MSIVFTREFLVALFAAGVRMSIPIMLPALGEIYAERAGIMNINLEGQMLMGAFASFIVGHHTGSVVLALLAGALAGMLQALLMACACIRWKAQHVVVGIVLNMFALGFTSFWYRVAFGVTIAPPMANVSGGATSPIPGLSKIPIIGQILFDQHFLFYIAVLLVIASHFILNRTFFGLRIKSAGEYPLAAETMGVNIVKTRYLAMMICGALAGLGGTFLSVISLNRFVDNITASRGFIALAIVIFGRWKPIPVFFSSLLFGTTDALQLRLQSVGLQIPYHLLLMLPYVLTVLVMILTSKNSRSPAALGTNFEREALSDV